MSPSPELVMDALSMTPLRYVVRHAVTHRVAAACLNYQQALLLMAPDYEMFDMFLGKTIAPLEAIEISNEH